MGTWHRWHDRWARMAHRHWQVLHACDENGSSRATEGPWPVMLRAVQVIWSAGWSDGRCPQLHTAVTSQLCTCSWRQRLLVVRYSNAFEVQCIWCSRPSAARGITSGLLGAYSRVLSQQPSTHLFQGQSQLHGVQRITLLGVVEL